MVAEGQALSPSHGGFVRFLSILLVCTLGLAGRRAAAIDVQLVAGGIPFLVDIEHAGDGSGRLFLVSQTGQIRVYDGTEVLPEPFLDLASLVSCCGERGLLGLAFHPSYAGNGFFYVDYTDLSGNTVIARYQASPPGSNVANSASATILLTVPQPFANHNGGQVRFGPDGFLYIALGDGGSGGDPLNNGQSLGTLLGKLLRIDVDSASPYAIPSSNPFANVPGARGEIWAYGLRNPWRFSFDRQTGDMFVGDVGQGLWEEIDFQTSGSGGSNYGWRLMEGLHCFNPSTGCNPGSLTLPLLEYSHTLGCSVTGGFRYRGTLLSGHVGTYFFADFCTGRIWGATSNAGGAWSATELVDTDLLIATFGEDPAGEIYLSNWATSGGLYRLVSSASVQPVFSDDPIVAGSTGVRAVHVTELRTRIDALRARVGLFPFSWTDSTLTAGIAMPLAVHITEMRTALNEAYVGAGRTPPTYASPAPVPGGAILATHIAELRSAVIALE